MPKTASESTLPKADVVDWNSIATRRKHFEDRPDDVIAVLVRGTQKANAIAEETLQLAKQAMKQDFMPPRSLTFGR